MKKRMPNSRKIMLGFLGIILAGTLLLMLPWATRAGEETTFLGALFCSTSATCVTGLVVYDTFSHWTLFGQLVLLVQIQIGGLGFITISSFLLSMSRKKIGVRRRIMIQESLNAFTLSGGVRMVRHIILGTILFEGVGALLLAARFIPEMGFLQGLYFGIFHGISAFCNAGFDLMGVHQPYDSLSYYAGDWVVMLTISALVIIGGIGFIVWEDVLKYRLHVKQYSFHTKVVLACSSFLLVVGTMLFWFYERNGLFAEMSGGDAFLAAFFSAVTPRTAGFNSVDTGALGNGALFLTIILMFIGGSPGSTAGGAKTVTVFVMLLHVKSYIFREKDCQVFGRRLDEDAVRRASVVTALNLFLIVIATMLILGFQNLPFRDVVFEVFSAIGTVGMTTGITRSLTAASKIVMIVLMYFGRMGTLTFAMSFTEARKVKNVRLPEGEIMIG